MAEEKHSMENQSHKKKILIVDDEEDLREILKTSLNAKGYETLFGANGAEALEVLSLNSVDGVISDIKMPKIGGIDLLTQFRQDIGRVNTAFILLTGFNDLEIAEYYHLGADAVIKKPFERKIVIETLNRLLVPVPERWRKPTLPKPAKGLQALFPSFEDAQAAGQLKLGRGGMFLKKAEDLPTPGQPFAFNIKFENRNEELIGEGLVRWVRQSSVADAQAGIGVEFITLSESAIHLVTDLLNLNSTKVFIPRT